jgi:hypothetical protein
MYTGIWQKQRQKQICGGFGLTKTFKNKMGFWFMYDNNLVKTKFVIHKYDSYLDKIKFVTVLTAFFNASVLNAMHLHVAKVNHRCQTRLRRGLKHRRGREEG